MLPNRSSCPPRQSGPLLILRPQRSLTLCPYLPSGLPFLVGFSAIYVDMIIHGTRWNVITAGCELFSHCGVKAFMGKSQETSQLAVGMNGNWGVGAAAPTMAFSCRM